MRPGQLTPNDFEIALLESFAEQDQSIRGPFERLHVLSREFTGVGSFTSFVGSDPESGSTRRVFSLDALVRIAGGQHLLGVVLFCLGDRLDCLEVFSMDGSPWDGVYDRFSIEPNQGPLHLWPRRP